MTLQPNIQNGLSFLVGDNTAESIILSFGQLKNYPGGLLALDGNDTVIGSEDSEFINGNTGLDSLIGNGGIDTLRGGKQDDILDGGSGNDFLAGDLDQDIVRGGDGNDSLYGGKNSDQLFGDGGDDILSGDKDNDILTGGIGKDTFVLVTDGGFDMITDFANGTDQIKLPDGITFNDILLQPSASNTLIIVQSTGEQLAQINNISVSNLTAASFGETTSNDSNSFEQRVFELTNQERLNAGLLALTYNYQLEVAAESHSQDMALQDYFDHNGLDGSSPFDRIEATGYNYSWAAENIAAGQTTPEQVVNGWMNSPGHRANILNTNLTEIGVGYYYLGNDTGNENFNHYWTQNFGTPA